MLPPKPATKNANIMPNLPSDQQDGPTFLGRIVFPYGAGLSRVRQVWVAGCPSRGLTATVRYASGAVGQERGPSDHEQCLSCPPRTQRICRLLTYDSLRRPKAAGTSSSANSGGRVGETWRGGISEIPAE